MIQPYEQEIYPDHIKYVIRSPYVDNKLTSLLGNSILSKMTTHYIKVDLIDKTWYPSPDFAWLYRNQPPLTTIEEIERLLNN